MTDAKQNGKHPGGRPLKFKSPQEMQIIIDQYFQNCDAKSEPYTITGLALALDTFRDVLIDYQNKDDEISNTIKKAKLKCEKYAENHGFSARNPAFAIFVLKNYGWSDKQEIQVSGNIELQDRLKQARERLKSK